MPVWAKPELIAVDLRTYGEDEVATKVLALSDEQLQQVYKRADHYLYADEYATGSGASPMVAWTLAMAAVEIVEGTARPLRWKRRKLKGIYTGR